MQTIKFVITLIFCLITTSCQITSGRTCFDSQPRDSSSFAKSLAMSDHYLAIGDANRVIVYTRTEDNQWLRTKEILPPRGSVPDKYNSGFGRNLMLDRSALVIAASIQKAQYEVIESKDFQNIGDKVTSYIFRGIYKTDLSQDAIVERLDVHKNNQLPGSFTADEGKIAFTIFRIEELRKYDIEYKLDKINILSKDEKNDLLPLLVGEERKLGGGIELKNNLLLVGASIQDLRTVGWLFDLEQLDLSPRKIIAPEDFVASSIELSDKFVVAGKSRPWMSHKGVPRIPPKTLITSIETGATHLIDGYGRLSLDGNILARLRYANPSIKEEKLLEVFRLDDNATAHRIIRRKRIDRALVYNNLLTTVQKTDSGKRVCIERVH